MVVILLIILMLVAVIIVILLIAKIRIIKSQVQDNTVIKTKTVNRIMPVPVDPIDVVREYDYKKLNDPLEEPRRRVPRHEIPSMYVKGYFDFATRGYPDNFSQLGLLIAVNKDGKDNKILRLFGRQIYPFASTYEYYTAISSGLDMIKIPLNTKKRELYDGDIILIKELNAKYKVQLLKFNSPKYYPDLIV